MMSEELEDPGYDDHEYTDPPEGANSNVRFLWEKSLRTTEKGHTIKNLRNVALILENAPEMQGVIAFDDFAAHLVATKDSPAGAAGPWTDAHDLAATVWVQGAWNLDVSDDLVSRGVRAVAAKQRVHPLREKLEALKWDGVTRLDTWTATYLGAEDTPVHRAIGSTWMLGAVARAFRPGCKVDAALILEGEQGKRKSTALSILALGYFSDELADIGSKDAAMQIHGAWIHEIAELDAFGRVEMSRVKAFLTRTHDRFRPPYGRHVVELARQCVFAGSVNHGDWLTDETGGRRFLPVRVGTVDLEALRRDVGQLWAEALVRFRAGDLTYIPDGTLNDDLRAHVAERYRVDAWHEAIETYARVHDTVSVAEILEHIGVEPARRGQHETNRAAKVLKFLGYERYQQRLNDARTWRYRKVTT
jgi:putative DNA primase/helicase